MEKLYLKGYGVLTAYGHLANHDSAGRPPHSFIDVFTVPAKATGLRSLEHRQLIAQRGLRE